MRNARSEQWRSSVILFCCSVIVMVAAIEVALFFVDDRYKGLFRRPPVGSEDLRGRAGAFFRSQRFDADLGWDRTPHVRNHRQRQAFLAQAYGDSFVLSGHGGITWETAFEDTTGETILNFGVGGYGLDQAVLKFEKYGSEYPTRIAIIGLYNQMFRRARSYHARYYFSNYGSLAFAFKPFFAPSDEGYKLHRPPCRDAECMHEVLSDTDGETTSVLKAHDYWYRQDTTRPALGFPRAVKYAQVLPDIWQRTRWGRRTVNYHFVDRESLELTKYLLKRFVAHAQTNGMVPICLLLYSSTDLLVRESGTLHDRELMDFLRAERIRTIDSGEYILTRYSNNDGFEALRTADGHLSNQGDNMVAAAVERGLVDFGLLDSAGSH